MKKQITAAMMIFAMIGTPAMAQGLDNQAFAGKVFHTEAGKSMQLAELSAQEMRETEGDWIPLAILGGAAIGMWTQHGISYATTGRPAPFRDVAVAGAFGAIPGGVGAAGRAAKVARNLRFDGPSKGLKYGNGRVFGIRHNSQPVFRVDYHRNPSPTKLHIHSAPDINAHRPWNAPWRKY